MNKHWIGVTVCACVLLGACDEKPTAPPEVLEKVQQKQEEQKGRAEPVHQAIISPGLPTAA